MKSISGASFWGLPDTVLERQQLVYVEVKFDEKLDAIPGINWVKIHQFHAFYNTIIKV